MSGNSHYHDGVREHYRLLSSDYGARANRTCEETYLKLVKEFLEKKDRVLEVGSGSSDLANRLGSRFAVGCDLSLEMLRARAGDHRLRQVVAAGEDLPFSHSQFNGVFLINVLEHVASVESALEECARVLEQGGVFVAVTPNGNWQFWLDLAEKWKLKLPEGPHTFLSPHTLRSLVEKRFQVLQHRTLLMLPVGSPALAALVDKVTFCAPLGQGFFQFIAARKKPSAG